MAAEAAARSVLVIDSDDVRAAQLLRYLGQHGAQVVRASEPEDGWRLFVDHRATIVLAELSPTSRGDKFLRRLQAEYLGQMPRTYFVCRPDDVHLASALEPDAILVPPFAIETLGSVLERHEPTADSSARQATRLRELYDLSLLGPDLYRAIDILAARAAIAFQATDCVIWGGTEDANWPRIGRSQPPADARLYFEQCKLAASGGVSLVMATGGNEGEVVVKQRARSFLAAPLGQSAAPGAGGICLVSDESRRFTTDERDALRVLARRTAHELAFVTAHRRLVAEQEKLRESALVDPLLGTWTRAALEQALVAQIEAARRRGEPLALAVLDFVSLRGVNDRYGHLVGDSALGHFAQTVRTSLRVQDMVGRVGGDELAILLVGCDLAAARPLVERTLATIVATPYTGAGLEIPITATAGLALINANESDMEPAVGRAYDAVRRARRVGESLAISDPARDWSNPSDVLSLGHERGLPGGATLGGMYRILHEISRGAMGVVYRGEDLGLGRPVAIKVMRSDLAQDKDLVTRFRDEAAMLASLHHVNLVQVYAFGAEGDDVYFVMELVEGEPLSDVITRLCDNRTFIGLDAAEKIVEEIADALEAIHALGIIHRDVKPANVLLDRIHDRAVLVDVGVAKRREDATDAAGTPGFSAPESFMDEDETTATDVYGLAATTYAMLTGVAPWTGHEIVEVVSRQLHEQPTEPSQIRSDISPAVDQVLFKAMAPEQSDRYESAAAFAIALSRALARQPEGDSAVPRKRARRRSSMSRLRRSGVIEESSAEFSPPGPPPLSRLPSDTALVADGLARSRGAWFRVAHKLLGHQLGADWVRRAIETDARFSIALDPQLSPTSWQPLELLTALLDMAASAVRDPHKLARSLGKITISATLPRFFGADPVAHTPMALLRAAESYWSRYHSWGSLSVREDGPLAVLDLRDSPGSPLLCSVIEGSFGRIAELAGGQDVATAHPQCVNDGGELCRFGIRWAGAS